MLRLTEHRVGSMGISPSSTAATVPALVPFTLNFTVTNLHYEEDMGRLGSWKFNTTERVLQGLVRALPTLLLPQPLGLAHLIPATPVEADPGSPHSCPNPTYLTYTWGRRFHPPHLCLHSYKPHPLMPAPFLTLLPCPSTHFPLFPLQLRILFKKSSVGPLYMGCRLTMLR